MADMHRAGSQVSFILDDKHGDIKSTAGQSPTLVLLDSCVGTKGCDRAVTVKASWRPDTPIIPNSSRAKIYAVRGAVLVRAARRVSLKMRNVLTAACG